MSTLYCSVTSSADCILLCIGTKNQKATAKRATKLNRRQAQRTEQMAEKEASIEAIAAAALRAAEEEEAALQADAEQQSRGGQTAEQAAEKRTASSSLSSLPDSNQPGSNMGDNGSGAEEEPLEVEGLLGKRIRKGVTEYQVAWKPQNGVETEPSWEPEDELDRKEIDAYEFYTTRGTSRGGRHGRGRGRGNRGR